MSFLRSLRSHVVLHSAVRFAIAIVIADALVWWIFREGTPVVMGSFAVICLLYFLDYEGSTSERFVGYVTAAAVGSLAVVLGSVLAGPLWLAVAGAFIVSFSFAYARVLRGYIARASVGLQGAFFLPLMADVAPDQTSEMVASWLIGSAVAGLAGLVILPKRRDGALLDLMGKWLALARDITSSQGKGDNDDGTARSLSAITHELSEQSKVSSNNLGMVGQHQRALAQMINGTQWGAVAFDLLNDTKPASASPASDRSPKPTTELLMMSAKAFDSAKVALTTSPPPKEVPDLPTVRSADLLGLTELSDDELRQHYPARLISILAMRMLWLAGRVRGVMYPNPDLGSTDDRTPLALLRLNFGWRSVWFTNALRTGASTAACVLLVRELGLDHGLWVVLAALSVTQVSFSASANGTSSLRLALGAAVGVVVASVTAILPLGHIAFVALLPILAFLAVVAARSGPFLAQSLYTPFALTNLAALQWTSDRDLEIARIENISLGVAVAAAFAFLVFPFGLSRQLSRQITSTESASRAYLRAAVQVAYGRPSQEVPTTRKQCIRAVTELESTLGAAGVHPTLSTTQEVAGQRADTLARDRLIGGDACVDLGQQRRQHPVTDRAADTFARWWEASPLLTDRGGDTTIG